MRRTYVLAATAVVAVVLGLQTMLPHRLDEGRSTEVLGKISFYLKLRPRGIALAQIADSFAWDRACVVRQGVAAAEFSAEAGITLPATIPLGERGPAWLLVFADGGKAVAVTEIPPATIGSLELGQPWMCVTDQNAFFHVIDGTGDDGPPRRFVLRI